MRVCVLRNLGAGWPAFKEGEQVTVKEDVGQKLIALGLAEELVAPKAEAPKAEKVTEQPAEKPAKSAGRTK